MVWTQPFYVVALEYNAWGVVLDSGDRDAWPVIEEGRGSEMLSRR